MKPSRFAIEGTACIAGDGAWVTYHDYAALRARCESGGCGKVAEVARTSRTG